MADKFKVHTAHETTVPVQTQFRGLAVTAQLPAVLVELVGLEPYQRSFTHTVVVDTPEKLAEARAMFRVDAVVEMSFAGVEA